MVAERKFKRCVRWCKGVERSGNKMVPMTKNGCKTCSKCTHFLLEMSTAFSNLIKIKDPILQFWLLSRFLDSKNTPPLNQWLVQPNRVPIISVIWEYPRRAACGNWVVDSYNTMESTLFAHIVWLLNVFDIHPERKWWRTWAAPPQRDALDSSKCSYQSTAPRDW